MTFELNKIFGYRFNDTSLLKQAFTHPSFINESRKRDGLDYQRLEFLGDAVLSLCLADILLVRYRRMPEGELSKLRASLVDQTTLAGLASDWEIGSHALLGKGEDRDGGRSKPSILSDILEAVLGAVYLDGGLEEAKKVIQSLYSGLLERPSQAAPVTDPKSELQELLASSGSTAPVYIQVSEEGPAHSPVFSFGVSVETDVIAVGKGSSKKAAQQAAAMAALEILRAQS